MSAEPASLEPASPRAAPRWALVAAYACHALLTFAVLPPSELARDAPLFVDDYVPRFRYALTRAALLANGQLAGYDPAFNAGFPECQHLLAGGHAWTLAIATLAPWLGEGRAFNVMTALLVLATLPLLAWAARMLALGAAASWVPIVAVPVIWTGVPFSFLVTGSPGWLCGVPLALAVAASYRSFLVTARAWPWARTALLAALAGTVHELAAAWVGLFALALLVERRRALSPRVLVGSAAILAAAALFNAHWIVPFVARRDVSLGYGGGTVGVLDARYSLLALFYPHGLPVVIVLYALAVAGARQLARRGRDSSLVVFWGSFVGAPLVFAFAGYAWRVTVWTEPYRFLVMFLLAACLLAAIGLAEAPGGGVRAWRRVLPWASPLVAIALGRFNPIGPELPLRAGIEGEAAGLVTLLEHEVDPAQRLLVEDSAWEHPEADWLVNLEGPGHHYFGTHLPTLLPELIGRELVNGAYVGRPFVRHQVVEFESRILDGRPIAAWPASELDALFRRYAIGHVLVWSREARAALEARAELLEPDGVLGELALFRVRAPSSRFLAGSGRIESTLDRIELSELVPENGRVVLRYHFDRELAASPPVRLERFPIDGDPIGFVALIDPPPRVRLGFHPERTPPSVRWHRSREPRAVRQLPVGEGAAGRGLGSHTSVRADGA
ncbi:MAG: hypothetical protein U0610_24180 [bacterium]